MRTRWFVLAAGAAVLLSVATPERASAQIRANPLSPGVRFAPGTPAPATLNVSGQIAAFGRPGQLNRNAQRAYPPGTTGIIVLTSGLQVIVVFSTQVNYLQGLRFGGTVEASGFLRGTGNQLIATSVSFSNN